MKDQKELQKQFNEFANDVLNSNATPVYKSVVAMIHTLIEDRKLISLNRLLNENYPEYYNNEGEGTGNSL